MTRATRNLLDPTEGTMDLDNVQSFSPPSRGRPGSALGMRDHDTKYSLDNLSKYRHNVPTDTVMGIPLNKYTRGMPSDQKDYEQYMAQQQSNLERGVHGVAKFLGATAITVAGGTVGSIVGVGSAIAQGDFTKIYDNEFQAGLDDAREGLREILPHYYTQQERYTRNPVHGIIPGTPGSANFWFDKVLDGMSFTVGAALTEVIWAKATLGMGTALRGMSRAARLNTYVKSVGLLKKLSHSENAGAIARRMHSRVGAARRATIGSLTLARQLTTSSGYEAGVESRMHMEELRQALVEKAGYDSIENMPSHEIDRIESIVRSSGIAAWIGNTILVGAGHMIQFPKLFGLNFGRARGGMRTGDVLAAGAGKWATRFSEMSKGQRVARNIGLVLKNPLYEGFVEEGGQKLIEETMENYWTKRYNPEGGWEISSLLHAGLNAFEHTYTSKEGLEEVALGFIIGAIGIPGMGAGGGIVGPIQMDRQRRQKADALVGALNANPTLSEALKRNAQNSVVQMSSQQAMDQYIAENDVFGFENAKNDAIYSYVMSRIDAGFFQDVIESAEYLKQLSLDEFKTELGIPANEVVSREKQIEIVDSFISKAEKIKKSADIVDKVYPGDNETIRDSLIYILSRVENIDAREASLAEKLRNLTDNKVDHDTIRHLGDQAEVLRMQEIDKELADKDITKDESAKLRAERKILERRLEEAKREGVKYYADAAYSQLAEWIALEKANDNFRADVVAEVTQSLIDLLKLKATRQRFIDFYNHAITSEGREQLRRNHDEFQAELRKIVEQETPDTIQDQDPSMEKPAEPGADKDILGLEDTAETTTDDTIDAKKAEIEKNRQEELTIDNKLVNETGKDRSGKVFEGGWIEHQEYVNEKYDDELKALEAEESALDKSLKDKKKETKEQVIDKTKEELAQEADDIVTNKEAFDEFISNYKDRDLSNQSMVDLFPGAFMKYPAAHDNKIGVLLLYPYGEVYFKDGSGKITLIARLEGKSELNKKAKPSDIGLDILNFSLTDFNISSDGSVYTINGVELHNTYLNKSDAIVENKNLAILEPVAVKLKTPDGKVVKIKNPRLANEIATYILMYEEALSNTLDNFIKEQGDEFVVVNDPKYNKDYNVYVQGDEMIVFNPRTNKRAKGVVADRVISQMRSDMAKVMESAINELNTSEKEAAEKTLGKIKKEIKDGLKELNISTRPATSRESLDAAPESQVFPPKKDETGKDKEDTRLTEKETREEVSEDEGITEGSEKTISDNVVDNLTEQKTLEETDTESKDYKEDTDINKMEVIDDEITQDDRLSELIKNARKGVKDISQAAAYDGKKHTAANEYLSDKGNDLSNVYGEFEVATDKLRYNKVLENFFNEHTDIESALKEGTPLSDSQIESLLSLVDSDSFTSNVLDVFPIRIALKNAETNKVELGDLFYHNSNYWNIQIPSEIYDNESPKVIKDKTLEHLNNEKTKVRDARRKILRAILSGKRTTVSSLKKGKGVVVNAPFDSPNRNRKLTEVFGKDAKNIIIGVAKDGAIIYGDDGSILPGYGFPGNVYVRTELTANGEVATLKLNPKKVGKDIADVIFQSFVQAHAEGGSFAKIVDHPLVKTQLTAWDILTTLVNFGDNTIQDPKSDTKIFKPWLLDTQLWVEKGKFLHFGDGKKLNLHDWTLDQRQDFIDWITTHKNHSLQFNDLNRQLDKDFHVGDIQAKKGDTFKELYINSGTILTDVIQPHFESPLLMFDMNDGSFTVGERVKDSVIKEDAPKQPEVKADELKPSDKIKNHRQLANLPEGSSIYSMRVNLDDYGNKASTSKSYLAKVVKDKDGDLSIITTESIKGLNTKLSNEAGLSKFFDNFLYEPQGIFYETTKTKPEDKLGLDDIGDQYAPFSRLATLPKSSYKQMDVKNEIGWYEKTIGSRDFIILQKNLIQVAANGKLAFGEFSRDAIRLYEMAEEGSLYHEAFHRVSLMMLSPDQRSSVYEEAAKQYKLDRSNERAIEEALAEKYRDYRLARDQKEKTEQKGVIARFFNDLYNLARALYYRLFGGSQLNDLTIERLFNAIDSGTFRYAKPNIESLSRLGEKKYYATIKGFESSEIRSWVKNIANILITESGAQSLKEVGNLNYTVVVDKLSQMRDAYIRVADSNDNADVVAKALSLHELYSRVVDNFDQFATITNDYLRSINIRNQERHSDDIFDTIETTEQQNEFEQYSLTNFQVSQKDNVLAEVKFAIATLPASSQRSTYNNLYDFVDFGSTWSQIMRNLYDSTDINEIMQKLSKMAEDNITYKTLYDKLARDENLKTQFEVSVRKSFNNYVNFLIDISDNKLTYETNRADIQRPATRTYREWSQAFFTSNLFSEGKIDKARAEKVIEDYNKLAFNVRKEFGSTKELLNTDGIKNSIISLFNRLSIPLEGVTLDHILNTHKSANNSQEALHRFVAIDSSPLFGANSVLQKLIDGRKLTDARGKEIMIKDALANESVIKAVAEKYIEARPEESEPSVLGPDGAVYFAYTNHTPISISLQGMIKDNGVQKLIDVTYNKNSYILDKLINDPSLLEKLDTSTFSGMYRKNTGDKGTEYFKLTDAQDYVMKLGFTVNNTLPLPTLGDRKVLHMLNGINRVPFELIQGQDGKWVIPDSSPIHDVLVGYLVDEKNAIDKAKQAIEYAEEYNNYDNLVRYYHFDYDSRGNLITRDSNGDFVGNGTKFRFFTDFNNKYTYDTSTNRKNVKRILIDRISEEMKYASDIGVIEIVRTNDGKITGLKNLMLDQNFTKIDDKGKKVNLLNKYNKNENAAIKDIVGDFVVNTIMMGVETDKLFLMDSAFYKDQADKEKRITVLGSGGDLFRTSYPHNHELSGKDSYNVSTLNTQQYQSRYTDSIYEYLVDRFKDEGYSQQVADARSKDRALEFNKVDATDGQMLIMPELHRSLSQRLGEWNDMHDNAYRMLESDQELSIEDEMMLMDIVMQPLKTVYFGPHFRGDGLAVPVYDKMAMGVLFKRFLKGSQLESLIDKMSEMGVDAVKFDTAVKVGETLKTDLYENMDTGKVKDNIQLRPYKQFFKHLMRQQVTPTKREVQRAVGTQVTKAILSNHPDNLKRAEISELIGELSNIEKGELFDRFDIVEENGKVRFKTLDSFANMLREDALLGQQSDNVLDALEVEDGKFTIELDALPDRKWIENRLISLINKATVDTILPGGSAVQVSSLGVMGKTAKDSSLKFTRAEDGKIRSSEVMMSVAMFRKVIPRYNDLTHEQRVAFLNTNPQVIAYRIPTQGYNSIMSLRVVKFLPDYYGDVIFMPYEVTKLTGSDFDIDKQYYVTHNYELVDKRTREYASEYNLTNQEIIRKIPYLTDENSSVKQRIEKYAEGLAENDIKDVNKFYGIEIRKLINKIELTAEQLAEIRYEFAEITDEIREATNEESLEHLRRDLDGIKEFNAKNISTSKQLMSELKDIKKLRHEDIQGIKRIKLESIDRSEFAKRPILKQNTKKAIQNRIVDIYHEIMLSDDLFTQTITPLDIFTRSLKNIAELVDSKSELAQRNASLQNAVPSYQQLVKRRNADSAGGIAPFALNNVNHAFAQMAELNLDVYIGVGNTTPNQGTSLYHKKGVDGEYITDWYSALISAFVDASKDNYISRLNINEFTYNATNLLVRAGAGIDSFYYIAQPAIIQAAKEPSVKVALKKRAKMLGNAMIEAKVSKEAKVKYFEEFSKDMFNSDILKEDIGKTEGDWKFQARQTLIMSKFVELFYTGLGLNKVVQLSQVDTKKYGINFAEIRSFLDRLYDEMYTSDFNNFDKMINDTFLSDKLINGPELVMQLARDRFITATDAFSHVHSQVLDSTKNRLTGRTKIINEVSNELFSTFALKFATDQYGLAMDTQQVNDLLLGDNSIAVRLNRIKTDQELGELKDHKIITMLVPQLRSKDMDPDLIISFNTQVRDKWDKDDTIRSWEDILASPKENVRKFGEDLAKYAMLTSGMQKSIYSFYQYIPVNYLKEIGYSAYIRDSLSIFNTAEGYGIMQSVVDEMFINAWNSDTLVPEIGVTDGARHVYLKQDYPVLMKLKYNNDMFLGTNELGQYLFKPYVKLPRDGDYVMYKYIGYDAEINQPVYKAIDKKSKKVSGILIRENGLDQSVFSENVLPKKIVEANHSKINNVTGYSNFVEVLDTRVHSYQDKLIFDKSSEAIVITLPSSEKNTKIESGEATAITRNKPLGDVGDIIVFSHDNVTNVDNKYVITQVEELSDLNAKDETWVEKWAAKEGVDKDYFTKHYDTVSMREGSHQTTFMRVDESTREVETKTEEINPQYEGKPEFNKLPPKSKLPTMTYAGIGSRSVPATIKVKMTELATELESLGYTLNTGVTFKNRQEGSDKAFADGTNKKNLFSPEDQGSRKREQSVAKEIHPNPDALKLGGLKLMARNTNQIFGENLNTPVDFVIAWTKDGKVGFDKNRPEGGTGQAVAMASMKNIPVLNLANENWRTQLDNILKRESKAETDQSLFTWARKSDNSYEVSTKGDSRFSAFNAKIQEGTSISLGMGESVRYDAPMSIEKLYQVDVKGYASIKEGKGNPPKFSYSKAELYSVYKNLWSIWAKQNPNLIEELREKAKGKVLTDMFANTEANQARALSEILNESTPIETSPFVSELTIQKIQMIPTGFDSYALYDTLIEAANNDAITVDQFNERLDKIKTVQQRINDGIKQVEDGMFDSIIEARGYSTREILGALQEARTHEDIAEVLKKIC